MSSSNCENLAKVNVDAGDWTENLEHFWNFIGYDEINYTTTPTGQGTLKKFRDLAEKTYFFRVHHLLCTGNRRSIPKWGSTNVYVEDDKGSPIYNFDEVDNVFDTYLKYNAKPFVELGFMPFDLADTDEYTLRNYKQGGWAYPPKDYDKWYDLIEALVKHCKDRYGVEEVNSWYWELWNEPDLDFYWKGTFDEYCKLYDYTSAAFKSVLPDGRIGGPATTGPKEGSKSSTWLNNFLEHCVNGDNYYNDQTGAPLDYVTFHAKGANYPQEVLAEKQLTSVKRLLSQVKEGLDIIRQYPSLEGIDVNLSECDPDGWAAGGAWDNPNLNFRNTEYYPSYVVSAFKNLMDMGKEYEGDLEALSWAFTFVGERCFEGTRSFTTRGIDKPILNLFRMLAKLGHKRLRFESTKATDPLQFQDNFGLESDPYVDGLASMSGDSKIQILLFCHYSDWDVEGEYEVNLQVDNLPYDSSKVKVSHYRLDGDHSNAYNEWRRQGLPSYPSSAQVEAIKEREKLELLEPRSEVDLLDGKFKKELVLPVHGISMLIIEES